MKQTTLMVTTEEDMLALGGQLASQSQPGSVIYLQGELGAGKTTVSRGFLRELGYNGTVKSPTYTFIEPYSFSSFCVYHIDLYRLEHPQALHDIGLSDYLTNDSILLIEWPEKAEGVLPIPDLRCCIKITSNGREVSLFS